MKKFFPILFLLLLVGCRPYLKDELFTIEPNETAFVFDLDDNTPNAGNVKFDSLEYLKSKVVASKRITVPTRHYQTGRNFWDVKVIPTMSVIKVNRAPVNVENLKINVESKDSIGLNFLFDITAKIKEEDAALFLYEYKGDTLEKALKQEVATKLLYLVGREFGKFDANEARLNKNKALDIIFPELNKFFAIKGITVDTIAIDGGIGYDDPKIQEAIDAKFRTIAQKDSFDVQKELNEKMALSEREIAEKNSKATRDRLKVENDAKIQRDDAEIAAINKRKKDAADAARYEAEQFAKVSEANVKKMEMEIEKIKAEAMMEYAKKSTGAVPQTVIVSDGKGSIPFVLNMLPPTVSK